MSTWAICRFRSKAKAQMGDTEKTEARGIRGGGGLQQAAESAVAEDSGDDSFESSSSSAVLELQEKRARIKERAEKGETHEKPQHPKLQQPAESAVAEDSGDDSSYFSSSAALQEAQSSIRQTGASP